jgi:cysteine desulfuration protein SufE
VSIAVKEQELIEEFSMFSDWMEKYEYIIDLGKDLPLIEESFKTEDYKIKGCQSQVWLHCDASGDTLNFTADSDAIITKGIISLLIRVLSNEKAEDIVNAELNFIKEIGLQDHLSPTRSNGLLSMVKQIKLYALAASKTQQA